MKERVALSLFYSGLIIAVIAVVLTGLAFHQSFAGQVQQDLRQQAELIAAACSEETPTDFSRFAVGGLRITHIDSGGWVLYESAEVGGELVNHLDRPEVQQALAQGSGRATRRSQTVGEEEYYYAVLLPGGDVLRVSMVTLSVYSQFERAAPVLFIVMVLLGVLSVGISMVVTRRLVRPIEQLPALLENADLSREPDRVYPELVPVVQEIQTQRREQENMRQEFTANVTHELKTPLTAISGYAEIISTGMARPEDVQRFAGKIHQEAERMQSLVNDIIELSRLDQKNRVEHPVPVSLYRQAEECINQLSAAADRKKVTLLLQGQGPAIIQGDEKQIWELIYNLVDNAIRYNREKGTVWVTVRDGVLTVRDNGIGIPEESQPRVFERFFRVDKSHSRATGGTGLGLSIVKHAAEQHDARISLKSTPNVGTEITVRFPAQPE